MTVTAVSIDRTFEKKYYAEKARANEALETLEKVNEQMKLMKDDFDQITESGLKILEAKVKERNTIITIAIICVALIILAIVITIKVCLLMP